MYQPGFRFICDYGRNIYAGDNVSVNMNCTFVDCSKITIGNHVLIVLHVRPYTATHPVEQSERLTPNQNTETGPYFPYLRIADQNGKWLSVMDNGYSVLCPLFYKLALFTVSIFLKYADMQIRLPYKLDFRTYEVDRFLKNPSGVVLNILGNQKFPQKQTQNYSK